ncbi:unnamed protein product [Cunninghamella blakesleeana]
MIRKRKNKGILSQLCTHIGVQGVQIEPIVSLNHDLLCEQKSVYGIIVFLNNKPTTYKDGSNTATGNNRIYFANQVVNNAYAMHALLSILLNCEIIDIGSTLLEFKQFTQDFSPLMKGLSLSNSEPMRESQNRVARSWPNKTDNPHRYHYISYIPFEGYLYELDGLKRGPLRLGPCTNDNWLDVLKIELLRKTDMYRKQRISFSIWSLVEDRRHVIQRKLVAKSYIKKEIEIYLDQYYPSWKLQHPIKQWEEEYQHTMKNVQNRRGMKVSANLSSHYHQIEDLPAHEKPQIEISEYSLNEIIDLWIQSQDELLRLYNNLGKEDEKHEKYQNDTTRRQHNYTPFIISYIEALQSEGILQHYI